MIKGVVALGARGVLYLALVYAGALGQKNGIGGAMTAQHLGVQRPLKGGGCHLGGGVLHNRKPKGVAILGIGQIGPGVGPVVVCFVKQLLLLCLLQKQRQQVNIPGV